MKTVVVFGTAGPAAVQACLADLSAIAEHLRGVDTCLFCLGISPRKVKGEDEYRTIHVLTAAHALLAQSPNASFVYLSGVGTNRSSQMMWARVKAEVEDQFSKVGLTHCMHVKPGFILGRALLPDTSLAARGAVLENCEVA